MRTERITAVLKTALREGLLDRDPAVLFVDLDLLRQTLDRIVAAFPPDTQHTIAVKANPLAGVLREALAAGFGAECASWAELQHALRLGFEPHTIVFDSPAKTVAELQFALERGIHVNVDNLQELGRVAELVADDASGTRVGLRVNPQVGAGAYEGTSTATKTSKFGIPLRDERERIIAAFADHAWLAGLHVHAGSQHCNLDLVVRGVVAVMELAREIHGRRGVPVEVIDIGGGLPVDMDSDAPDIHLDRYVELLNEQVPDLFETRIITEFGRASSARTGWAVSRVEYTKRAGGRAIAVIHLGADFLVRTAYVPDVWSHRITVHTPDGAPKEAPAVPQDVAGPLCFTHDLCAQGRLLPAIEPGDHVVLHDVGAYTLSMWSRYNSRLAPPVYGVELEDHTARLSLLKPAETVDEVLSFWGN